MRFKYSLSPQYLLHFPPQSPIPPAHFDSPQPQYSILPCSPIFPDTLKCSFDGTSVFSSIEPALQNAFLAHSNRNHWTWISFHSSSSIDHMQSLWGRESSSLLLVSCPSLLHITLFVGLQKLIKVWNISCVYGKVWIWIIYLVWFHCCMSFWIVSFIYFVDF